MSSFADGPAVYFLLFFSFSPLFDIKHSVCGHPV